jgi:LacI family transcriptional regulator
MNILDIAAEAGVSTATVSRVLNDGPVTPATRAKVEAAIRKLNYLPNGLARGLITGRSMNIGVLTHSLSNSFSWEFVEAAGEHLKHAGYCQFLASSGGNPDEEAKYVASFLSQKVDGIVVHDPSLVNYEAGLFVEAAKRVPLVMVHSFLQDPLDVNAVIVDQALGMKRVMEFLLGLGHRDLWMVRSVGYSQDLKERVWREALSAVGAPPPDHALVFIADGDVEKGVLEARQAVRERLDRGLRPTAVFASNDLMGVGAQAALRDVGLRIPEDVSLVGHDNTILAQISGFSSVDLKTASVGQATVDLLLSGIRTQDRETRRVYLTPDIIHRGSTQAL